MVIDFLRKQFIDVIEWHEESGQLAWRVPIIDNEIQNGAQLTVRDGQIAAFFDEGRLVEYLKPGRHTLDTANLPFLTSIQNWDKGFKSPSKNDIIFYSLKDQTGLKWGTSQPITVRDTEFGALRVRAFGSYAITIDDIVVFTTSLFGTQQQLDVADIEPTLRGAIQTAIANGLAASGTAFLDLAANQATLSEQLREAVDASFKKWGLTCPSLFVESISLPEEVQRSLDKGSSMRVIGDLDRYARFQTAEAIEAAAGQDGGLGGIGAGMVAAASVGSAMSQAGAAPAAAAAENDPFALIEKLHKLLTIGAISEEEFNAKKAEILSRLK